MAVKGSGGGTGKGGAIRAGRAFVELSANDAGLRSGLTRARQAVLGFGKSMAKIGAGLFGLGGLPAAAGLAKIVGTLRDLGKQGDMAAGIGVTAEAFTGLASAFDRFGIDAQGAVDVLTDVADWVQDAAVNGGDLAETFGFMGVNAKELMGLRPDEQFLAIADALSKLDPTLAAGLAARLGGDFVKLLPLIRRGSGAIRELAGDLSSTAGEVEEARKANAAYEAVTAKLSYAWTKVAVALAPAITQIAGRLVPALKEAVAWLDANKALVAGLAAGLAAVATAGAGLMAFGLAVTAAGIAAGALGTVLGVVFSPVGLGVLAVVGATAAILEFNKSATGAGGLAETFGEIGQTFRDTFDGVKDALSAGEWEAAFELILAGLKLAWAQFMDSIGKSFEVFWEKVKRETRELGANAALARGKKPEDGAWWDAPAALWGEFQHDVLGGKNPTDRGPLVRGPDGKMRLSPEDAALSEAVKAHADALERSAKAYEDKIKEIMKAEDPEVERMKRDLAAKREAARVAANTKAFADFMGDVANTRLAFGQQQRAAAAGLAGVRGGFGSHLAAQAFGANNVADKIERNTAQANKHLEKIERKVGGLDVD